MYVASHNFVAGRGNCRAFPASRPGFRFSDLASLARRSRGLGQTDNPSFGPGAPCFDSSRPAWWPSTLPYGSEYSCLASSAGADFYTAVEYGAIPAPVPPVPLAPQTADQMSGSGWNVDDTFVPDMGQPTIDAINAAIAGGSYNPSGNLPAPASSIFWPLLGLAAVGLVVYLGVKH